MRTGLESERQKLADELTQALEAARATQAELEAKSAEATAVLIS